MKVILLEDVKSLGKKGQLVDVSDGYARNFILAKKLGLDPAIMAAPLITTILDTCTILVYFNIVTVFFGL